VKMKLLNSRLARKLLFFFLGFVLMAGTNSVFLSCSTTYKGAVDKTAETVGKTTKKLTRKIRFSDDDLQRMAAVIGFENKSLYRAKEFAQVFRKGIPDYLNNECDDVTVANSGTADGIRTFRKLPMLESGEVDNVALAIIGRELGLNAVVTGSLDDIGLVDELRGMMFKKNAHLIQVLVSVEVYDTETGAKILDQNYSRELEIDEFDYDLMKTDGKLILPDLNESLNDMVAEIGEEVCWAIEDQPWNGYITAIAGQKITLSSGSSSGLETGDQLEVFDTSRILEGRNGQRFILHGKKIGELRIVEVEPGKAKAVIVSDEGIKTGSSVRVK
jgi:hypothetical protein